MSRAASTFFAVALICSTSCRDTHQSFPDAAPDAGDGAVQALDGGLDGGPGDGGNDGGADAGPVALGVLFIGNSYTFVNDLPGMLARLAATAGTPPAITVDQVVEGGAYLMDHWNAGIAQARINERRWTHVVLQGQSLEPIGNVAFPSFAQRFGDVIADAGAQPALYVTWARAPGDPIYAPPQGSFISPDEMQDRLTSAYAGVGQKTPQGVLSCVGEAFRSSLREHPEIVLHQSDGSHPTVAGTYLAAATFYNAITGQPVPATSEVPPDLTVQEAQALREAARVGSNCADVHVKAIVRVREWSSFFGVEGPDGGPPFDYGTTGGFIPSSFFVVNTGDTAAGITDGLTLAPPFVWTAGGAYPGGSGSVSSYGTNYDFCSSSLPAHKTCVVSVGYTAAGAGSGRLTLNLTGAYTPKATRALRGTATTRALLMVSENPGYFGCTDTTCSRTPAYFPAPGGTVAFNLVVTNRGGAPTTSLGVGTPLDPPFYWGSTGTSGTFPGDGDAGFCTTPVLGPGQHCLLALNFSPTAQNLLFTSAANLAYSDATGPVSPNANRNVQGSWPAGDAGPK